MALEAMPERARSSGEYGRASLLDHSAHRNRVWTERQARRKYPLHGPDLCSCRGLFVPGSVHTGDAMRTRHAPAPLTPSASPHPFNSPHPDLRRRPQTRSGAASKKPTTRGAVSRCRPGARPARSTGCGFGRRRARSPVRTRLCPVAARGVAARRRFAGDPLPGATA